MLTKGDDFPLHQTPEPIAYCGTDRNFYDRYFFNGYTPDGSLFFAVAFGVYPHVNLADAHFAIMHDGVEYCLHASRHLDMERMDLQVGPIRIVVEEPLQRLRILVRGEQGIAANIVFQGRAFPIEEPRCTLRSGPRTIMDYTRLTQNCRCSGWIDIDGRRLELPADTVGTRDRSWGIRPLGATDPQPLVPAVQPSLYWRWTPLNFQNTNIFFHIYADSTGNAWNTRAAIVPDGGTASDIVEIDDVSFETSLQRGTRYAHSGTLRLMPPGQAPMKVTLEPIRPYFLMRGIGYFNAAWSHGTHKGALAVEREDIVLSKLNPMQQDNLHIQALSRATLERDRGIAEVGIGVFEQLILGPYGPLRLNGYDDAAA